ncbi:MAG: hypothetical protein WAO91_08400 [Candidatus Nitrosotenuis sp.]
MPIVDVNEEVWKKLQEFKKVVEAILEDNSVANDDDYINLVLKLGLEKMIIDILPKEEPTLTKDILNMFNENPVYVSQHILDNLNRGKENEPADKIKEKWLPYG